MNEKTQLADRVLDALGNQTRRDILTLLRDNPMPVGSISTHLPISRPAVSKHLRILQDAGLVGHRASGTRNIFYLEPSGFQEARLYLDRFWDQALVNFQRAVEQTGQQEP